MFCAVSQHFLKSCVTQPHSRGVLHICHFPAGASARSSINNVTAFFQDVHTFIHVCWVCWAAVPWHQDPAEPAADLNWPGARRRSDRGFGAGAGGVARRRKRTQRKALPVRRLRPCINGPRRSCARNIDVDLHALQRDFGAARLPTAPYLWKRQSRHWQTRPG
jgi:hypothetical protein